MPFPSFLMEWHNRFEETLDRRAPKWNLIYPPKLNENRKRRGHAKSIFEEVQTQSDFEEWKNKQWKRRNWEALNVLHNLY